MLAAELEELDSFFSGLDPSMLGESFKPPTSSSASSSGLEAPTSRAGASSPDDEAEGDGEGSLIDRLMSELTARDLRIASLATENESLRSELTSRKTHQQHQVYEAMLSEALVGDGGGGSSSSSSSGVEDTDGGIFPSLLPQASSVSMTGLSELGLVGGTNLLLTEQQKAHLEERRDRELQVRLAGVVFVDRRKGQGEGEEEEGGRGAADCSTDSEEDRLFRDSGTSSPEKKAMKREEEEEGGGEMSYQNFLDRLMLPECEVLVGVIRRFLASVLGPLGDGVTPPPPSAKVDYDFIGTANLARRCADFFSAMHDHFLAHPAWRVESEERLFSACDCLEKYVMSRLAELAFQSSSSPQEDDAMGRRLQLLCFLKPESLEISCDTHQHNELIWALAGEELRRINSFKTPGEKVACIVKCAGVIFRSLSLSNLKAGDSSGAGAGADDFLPVFIWVVLRSHVPKLASNCAYIESFHSPRRLMGKAGYCLVNLRSALEFISSCDGKSISGMDSDEFDRNVREQERMLGGGFL